MNLTKVFVVSRVNILTPTFRCETCNLPSKLRGMVTHLVGPCDVIAFSNSSKPAERAMCYHYFDELENDNFIVKLIITSC